MELVNRTPIPARLVLAEIPGKPHRMGFVTAKATFCIGGRDEDGGGEGTGAALDTQDPYPIFEDDVETPLGILPRDDLPRKDPAFEVILLGAAHAPQGRPVEERRVSLSVGNERRELAVFGDRVWEASLGGRQISRPIPFLRMPLTYDRAFGGSCEVFVDREAAVMVSDPRNPDGKGLDPGPSATAIGKQLKAPPGYPVYDKTRRLPNVESPRALISRWEDAPPPAGWATLPLSSATHALRAIDTKGLPATPPPRAVPRMLPFTDGIFHRAHPDWVIQCPPRGAKITLEGLRPEGRIELRLPALRVLCDYVAGDWDGTLELIPQVLVLLPEEKRFYMVYRRTFNVVCEPGEERSMRLRSAEGWRGRS